MRWYLRRADTSAEHKASVGIAMMLMNAALIAAVNAWAMPAIPANAPEIGRPSWIALLILIFAMIAPGAPRQMFWASLVAASFDPLAHLVVWLFGGPAPTLVRLLILCWPSYACAFVVVVPAKVLHRISRRLKEAQELGSYHLIERARARRDGRSLARRTSPARARRRDQAGAPRSPRRAQRR